MYSRSFFLFIVGFVVVSATITPAIHPPVGIQGPPSYPKQFTDAVRESSIKQIVPIPGNLVQAETHSQPSRMRRIVGNKLDTVKAAIAPAVKGLPTIPVIPIDAAATNSVPIPRSPDVQPKSDEENLVAAISRDVQFETNAIPSVPDLPVPVHVTSRMLVNRQDESLESQRQAKHPQHHIGKHSTA
ncbi:hypothetical protein C8J56DRAFT_910289 [Mycena floridula]|nr:hypothetical protein C8J56DRAFT_910289 [Mycena floridula]